MRRHAPVVAVIVIGRRAVVAPRRRSESPVAIIRSSEVTLPIRRSVRLRRSRRNLCMGPRRCWRWLSVAGKKWRWTAAGGGRPETADTMSRHWHSRLQGLWLCDRLVHRLLHLHRRGRRLRKSAQTPATRNAAPVVPAAHALLVLRLDHAAERCSTSVRIAGRAGAVLHTSCTRLRADVHVSAPAVLLVVAPVDLPAPRDGRLVLRGHVLFSFIRSVYYVQATM